MKRPYCNIVNLEVDDLQTHAESILEKCGSRKPVIAVDLDYTIWNANCFEHTQEPFLPLLRKVGGKYDATCPVSVSCTDKRTNIARTLELFSEVRDVLEWCLDNDILLTVVSKSPDKNVAEKILKAFNMWDWFLLPQVFSKRKSYHFRNLTECTGLKLDQFLFFDDDLTNVDICNSIGVTSCQVNKEEGLNWRSLAQGLDMFYSKLKSTKRLPRCRKSVSWEDSPVEASDSTTSIVSFDSDCHGNSSDSADSADSQDSGYLHLFSEYMRDLEDLEHEKQPVIGSI